MNLEIINKKNNPLLSRTEVNAKASFFKEATPKKEEIKKQIALMEKVDEKLVVVKRINTFFGAAESSVLVYIYDSEEELKKIEPKIKEKESKEKK